jgi:hypothetical protein
LKPLQEFLLDNNMGNEMTQNFLFLLGIISKNFNEDHDKINFRAIEPSSEMQKDLVISELESKLNSQVENTNILSNKVFSLQKQIAALKTFKSETYADSPSKKPRIDQGKDESNDSSDPANQELMTKFKIISVELDELRKIASIHMKELCSLQSGNKNLLEELESKKDQVFFKSDYF